MLDLSNSLIVCSSLLLLMFLVAGSWGSMAVTGCMGVENPYVKKAFCRLSPQKCKHLLTEMFFLHKHFVPPQEVASLS